MKHSVLPDCCIFVGGTAYPIDMTWTTLISTCRRCTAPKTDLNDEPVKKGGQGPEVRSKRGPETFCPASTKL